MVFNLSPSQMQSTSFNGSDCTGSNGDANRTLATGVSPFSIVMERETLHLTSDYTISGSTVTFLVNVFDVARIEVVY